MPGVNEAAISLGFGGGQLIRQGQEQEAALAAARIAELASQVGLQSQQARYYGTKATHEETQVAAQKRFAEQMTQLLAGRGGAEAAAPPPSPGKTLLEFARVAADSGMPEEAAKYLKAGSQIATNEATQAAAAARRDKDTLLGKKAKLELGSQLLNGVTDETTAAEAEARYRNLTGESLFDGHSYSPQLVDRMRAAGMTALQQQDLALKQVKEKRETVRDSVQNALDAARTSLAKTREGYIRSREESLGKAGGKAVASPPKGEVDAAIRLIKEEFPKIPGVDNFNAAYSVAARARALRRVNPALDADTALRQALGEARQAGDFAEESGTLGFGTKTRFKGGGKSAEAPMPLPDKADKLIDGRFYYNSKGQIAQVAGGKLKLVTGAALPPGVLGEEED